MRKLSEAGTTTYQYQKLLYIYISNNQLANIWGKRSRSSGNKVNKKCNAYINKNIYTEEYERRLEIQRGMPHFSVRQSNIMSVLPNDKFKAISYNHSKVF